MTSKTQRIRDPLHNLITFDVDDKVDMHLWTIMQTEPMQRLRRIRQLGFAEYVYPGATHTRFAHSVGVMHIARRMLTLLDKFLGEKQNENHSEATIFAALLHDIGHGPFSHAFEEALKDEKGNKTFKHEKMTIDLIKENSELTKILSFRPEITSEIKRVILSHDHIYASVVSSQFDADRLDYMQRDALMTGTHHGAIDFEWLQNNLTIGDIKNANDESTQSIIQQIFVVSEKTIQATETYLLGLLQLYQTVYFHKTTRGVEQLFAELLRQIKQHLNKDIEKHIGLPPSHPLIKFLNNQTTENFLSLDDTVILGALPMMKNAKNNAIADISSRLLKRELLKCTDLHANQYSSTDWQEKKQDIISKISEFNNNNPNDLPALFFDSGERPIYKRNDKEGDSIYNNIYYQDTHNIIKPLDEHSVIVNAIKPFIFGRIYYDGNDKNAKEFTKTLVKKP